MKEFLFWNPVSTAKGLSIQESRIPVPQTKNPESSRNSRRRIHNPRIFRISLHGVAKAAIFLHKKARVYIWRNQFERRVLSYASFLNLKFVESCSFLNVT